MTTKLNTKTKIEYIKVSALIVDPEYQRGLEEPRAAAIAQNIDLARIGVLVVSRRADGACVVVDGQHRHAALIGAGMGECLVRCEVHTGLDQRSESQLFLKLNGGRKAVGALDKYKAELKAEDAVALEIDRIVRGLKLKIAAGNGRRSINAILAVKSTHLRQKNLERTLRVLAQWDDRAATFSGELIKAMSIFLAHYDHRDDCPPVDDAHLLRQLRNQDPDAILGVIKRRMDPRGAVKLPEAGCFTFGEIYNRRIGPKRKLAPYIRGGRTGVRTESAAEQTAEAAE